MQVNTFPPRLSTHAHNLIKCRQLWHPFYCDIANWFHSRHLFFSIHIYNYQLFGEWSFNLLTLPNFVIKNIWEGTLKQISVNCTSLDTCLKMMCGPTSSTWTEILTTNNFNVQWITQPRHICWDNAIVYKWLWVHWINTTYNFTNMVQYTIHISRSLKNKNS